MTTKVIYFSVGGREEQAEFRSDFPADDVKGKSPCDRSGCLPVSKPQVSLDMAMAYRSEAVRPEI